MTPPLRPRREGRAVTKLNRLTLLAGAAVLGLLVSGALVLRVSWPQRTPVVIQEPPQEPHLKLPEAITRELPRREAPAAPVILQEPPSPEPTPAPRGAALPAAPPIQASILDTINPFSGGTTPPAAKTPPLQQAAPPPAQPSPAPARPRKGWDFQAKRTRETASPGAAGTRISKVDDEHDPGAREGTSDLIRPARWAMPQEPLKTMYRSQTLTGRLLQAINSDIPGQVKIQTTTPVLDKFGYDTTIVPKDSIIIAVQESTTQYGTQRIPLRLEQLEFPTGEVVALHASIGDQEGANGLTGKVNNHIGKLLLATGISALLNIGTQVATGTPDGFYANPAQQAARDIGAKVQRDTESIVDRQLRRPATITIPAGTFCTINLQENIQFHRPPIVAR